MKKTTDLSSKKKGIVRLKIGRYKFNVDTTDIEKINTLIAFNAKYNGKTDAVPTQQFIIEQQLLIDKILGAGAYKKLFPKPTLKAYILCFHLVDQFQLGLVDLYTELLQENAVRVSKASKEIVEAIESDTQEFDSKMKQAEEVAKKYGKSTDKRASSNDNN